MAEEVLMHMSKDFVCTLHDSLIAELLRNLEGISYHIYCTENFVFIRVNINTPMCYGYTLPCIVMLSQFLNLKSCKDIESKSTIHKYKRTTSFWQNCFVEKIEG